MQSESSARQQEIFAVNESDRAVARRGVQEGRIVGHQSEIFRTSFDLPDIHGPDRPVFDREGIGSIGAIISNREAIL